MMRVMTVIFAAVLVGTGGLSAQEVVLDIPAIAGKSEDEVAAVLGSPSGRETTQHQGKALPKVLYRNGDVEVVYVNGKADWITLYKAFPLRQSSLAQLNLPIREPTFTRQGFVMRWEGGRVPGVQAVYFFRDYVYVNVLTSP